jgi:hypothetical protein
LDGYCLDQLSGLFGKHALGLHKFLQRRPMFGVASGGSARFRVFLPPQIFGALAPQQDNFIVAHRSSRRL